MKNPVHQTQVYVGEGESWFLGYVELFVLKLLCGKSRTRANQHLLVYLCLQWNFLVFRHGGGDHTNKETSKGSSGPLALQSA